MDNKKTDQNSPDGRKKSRDGDELAERDQPQPPVKGTDIPATTDLENIDREKGKRTTM